MGLLDLSLIELRNKIVDGEITSEEVVKECLENRIGNLNEYITLDKEGSLEKAREIDRKIANGDKLGKLAGIPISIKDNIITKDFKTTAASKILEDFTPSYDAKVIEKILEEDAIIIGKTNMDEFAMGSTGESSYYGPVKNPFDTTRTAGGSSGGAASTVASKSAAFGLGSDTGGSVRQPAAYCGVVGLKPTYGRVSRNGLITMSNTLDQIGLIGKNVMDTAYVFNIVEGKDDKDPSTLDYPKIDLEKLQKSSVKDMKIAVPKEFVLAETGRKAQTELSKAIKIFTDLGAEVEEVELPILKYANALYTIITSGDISGNMARYDGIRYGFRAKDYTNLEELYKNTRTQGFGIEVKKRILFGTYLLSEGRGKEYYDKALKIRQMMIDDLDKIFEKYDVILSLTSSMEARQLGEKAISTKRDSENMFLSFVNLAGLCGISVPAKVEGLPIGIQLVGNRFEEEKILTAALAYERVVR